MEQKDYISMFIKFVTVERTKIDRDKWEKGFSLNRDPGEQYVIEWIDKNAAWFRNAWNESDCKKCKKWKECGWKVEKECKDLQIE